MLVRRPLTKSVELLLMVCRLPLSIGNQQPIKHTNLTLGVIHTPFFEDSFLF
jgi:hypothetical protein